MSKPLRRYFLESTTNAHKQVTEIYYFIWPTIVSFREFKSKIETYDDVIDNITEEEFNDTFANDFEFNNIDFRNSVIDQTEEAYMEKFANVLLTNLFAIYEGWLEEACESIGFLGCQHGNRFIKFKDTFQFPFANRNRFGVIQTLSILNQVSCDEMEEAFHANLIKNPKYSLNEIQNQLKCYRLFKEIRNSFIHSNGNCNQRVIDAHNSFNIINNPAGLNVKESIIIKPLTLDKRIELDIRSIVGLSDIIIRLITTIDAEIAKSVYGRTYLVNEWDNRDEKRTMKKDRAKRERQFYRQLRRIGVPVCMNISKLHNYFEGSNLLIM